VHARQETFVRKLDGKVALVTGANKGVGKGIARGLAHQGAGVVLAARGTAELQATADEIAAVGVPVLVVATDVTDESQVESLFVKTLERFGRLDILVNNAGAFDGGPIDELSTGAWDKVIAVNLRAPFLCTRAAFRIMKKQHGGRIINIGSISAQRVRPSNSAYNASKFGIVGLTHSTTLEGRAFGISCGALHPGNTRSELTVRPQTSVSEEPLMDIDDRVQLAVTMAALPPNVNLLEAIFLPIDQPYVGRG
jgi:NAD(P)-dependent dehydrogenase (short-subunit alcohol dehydrogenase family)